MATISGILKNASGVRSNTKIILKSIKTTGDVLSYSPDFTIVTDANGAYKFECNPSLYSVTISQNGMQRENVGAIRVYYDTQATDINTLILCPIEDLTPEIVRQVLEAQEAAEKAAAEAEAAAANAADEYSQIFQDRFNLLRPVPWTANTQIAVKQQLQVFEYEKLFYLPDPNKLPFNTGTTFDNSQFTLSELVTAHQMRTDSASQLGGVYKKDYATGDVIPPDAMTNKLMYWNNGQFYSVGTDTRFTSNDFDADLGRGWFVNSHFEQSKTLAGLYSIHGTPSDLDWGARINIAANKCRETGLTLWIPAGTYLYTQTIDLRDVCVQWDGVLELTANTIGILLRYHVTLSGRPHIKRSKQLATFDKIMVLLSAPSETSGDGRLINRGCVENSIENLFIENGFIDYSIDPHGYVADNTKLTGYGLVLLAGSWTEGLTNTRNHEFVWRNNINDVFVDGFEYPYELRGTIDNITPNRWITWVNGNKLSNLCARRFKSGVSIKSKLLKPDGTIGAEVAGNTLSGLDLQWSSVLSDNFIYCEGRGNKFELMGWDAYKATKPTVIFQRSHDFPRGYAEASDNIVEVYGGVFPYLNGSAYSEAVLESEPGSNTFISPSRASRDVIPETVAPSVGSGLSQSYIPKVDNYLAFATKRTDVNVSVLLNGSAVTVDLSNAFDFNPVSEVGIKYLAGGTMDIIVTLNEKDVHLSMIGFNQGFTKLPEGVQIQITTLNADNAAITDVIQPCKTTVITGNINAWGVKTIRYRLSGFESDGAFSIGAIYAKSYSKDSSRGFITVDGKSQMIANLQFSKWFGIVLEDEKNTNKYQLAVVNGEVVAKILKS